MSVKPLKVGKSFFIQSNLKKQVNKPVHKVEKIQEQKNQSIDINDLMGKLINKIDNIPTNVYGENYKKTDVIDVDIKKQILIDKVDKNAVKSQVFEGKVNNKVDKLRNLRRRNK
tara:strand:+ start:3518 stop:3859 length:342 start_codon:yes stop_codon:yes gene_type:complete